VPRVSVIIPGRCETYFQHTVDSVLEAATGDIEIIAVVDGDEAEPRLYSDDSRVKIIRLNKAIGQRAAYNLGVRTSSGLYVMKIDAHAKLSKGFDEVLQSHCPNNAVVLPEMRRLDVRKWTDKRRGKTHFMFPGLDLYCHYWSDYRKRSEAKVAYPDVMTGQGSCWFTTREWSDYIGLLDEGVGSWGNVGIEISLRTWLCGGSQILNRDAWQAHWFRVGQGGFPYPMSGRQVARAHKYTWDKYYFKDNAFENQTRPFHWLIEKFAPVPGWETYLVDRYDAPRVILYYTDSQLHESLARQVRKNLATVAGPIPIVSVSQKPLDFGRNICVGDLPRCEQSMYRQIVAGAEAIAPMSIVYLAEHDVFYHASHFAKLPRDHRAFWFNQNRFYWAPGCDTYLPAGKHSQAFSQAAVYREYLLDHCVARLAEWTGRMKVRHYSWKSKRPNVDIRHGANLSADRRNKAPYIAGKKRGVPHIDGWGGVKHFRGRTGYKGVLRTDVINYLIQQNNYTSYLEIGVDRGDNWKHIACKTKHGIDPLKSCTFRMTSDEFFAGEHGSTYDLIFVDGLHEAEQAERDITNGLTRLNPSGVVVVHDCHPRNEREQRTIKPVRGSWTGDVWRAWVGLRNRSDLFQYVVDTNNGVGIVRPGSQVPLGVNVDGVGYRDLAAHATEWLNLKPIAWFWEQEKRTRCTETAST